jgi:hypothetical protein
MKKPYYIIDEKTIRASHETKDDIASVVKPVAIKPKPGCQCLYCDFVRATRG